MTTFNQQANPDQDTGSDFNQQAGGGGDNSDFGNQQANPDQDTGSDFNQQAGGGGDNSDFGNQQADSGDDDVDLFQPQEPPEQYPLEYSWSSELDASWDDSSLDWNEEATLFGDEVDL